MKLSCRHIQPLLPPHLEGALPAVYRPVVDDHLDGCASCRADLAASRSVHLRLQDACRPLRLDRGRFADAVMARLDAPHPAPVAARGSLVSAFVRAAAALLIGFAPAALLYLRQRPVPATRSTAGGELTGSPTLHPDQEPFHPAVGLNVLQPVRPVLGRITRIDGRRVSIDLGEHDGVRAGTSLMVFRQASDDESDIELVASIVVDQVGRSGSEAVVRSVLASHAPEPGDQVATAPFEAMRERHHAQLEADRLLAKLRDDSRIERGRRLAVARHHFQAGLSLFDRTEYDRARREFEQALAVVPADDDAGQELRRRLGWYLRSSEQYSGVATHPEIVLSRVLEEERVRRKLLAIEVTYRLELGRELLAGRRYADAIAQLELVREIADWLAPGGPAAPAGSAPPAIEPESLLRCRRDSDELLRRAREQVR